MWVFPPETLDLHPKAKLFLVDDQNDLNTLAVGRQLCDVIKRALDQVVRMSTVPGVAKGSADGLLRASRRNSPKSQADRRRRDPTLWVVRGGMSCDS